MTSSVSDVLAEILHLLDRRLRGHEAEITATLRRVAKGEAQMPETISAEEAEQARAIFGWIAHQGPAKVWSMLGPLLSDPAQLLRSGQPQGAGAAGGGQNPGFPAPLAKVLSFDRRTQARLGVLLLSYLFHDAFRYPQAETGVYDIAGSPLQKLKWLYRYWFNQLEIAEEGSNLERFFAAQSLEMPAPAPQKISVSCAGDLLAVDILTPKNTAHLFDDIAYFYSSADIVSANLETTVDRNRPFGRTQEAGQPARMNTSEEMFRKFREDAGINYFSTATNHAMDWGEEGLCATLDVIDKSGAYRSGTSRSRADQDNVLVIEKNGIKLALLAFTFDLNGYDLPADKPYLVNVVRFNDAAPDYTLVRRQVAAAKAKGAEHIIAYCHWGWEFEMYPHVATVEAAREMIACGVDTILGNHPHVSQPAELVERPDLPPALVIYAFGDFVSYHPESRNSKLAYVVKFDIVKDGGTGRVRLANLRVLPIYIANSEHEDGTVECRIVKFGSVLKDPDGYGLTDLEKSQLPHLRDKVWKGILSPLSSLPR